RCDFDFITRQQDVLRKERTLEKYAVLACGGPIVLWEEGKLRFTHPPPHAFRRWIEAHTCCHAVCGLRRSSSRHGVEARDRFTKVNPNRIRPRLMFFLLKLRDARRTGHVRGLAHV